MWGLCDITREASTDCPDSHKPCQRNDTSPSISELHRRGSSNDLGSYAWTVCRQDQESLRHQQLGGTFCSELSAWATYGHLAWLLKVAESKSYKTGIR